MRIKLEQTKISLDIWFLFGSFAYGVEAVLESCSGSDLYLNIIFSENDDILEVQEFLNNISSNPKGLLRSQLKIYPENVPTSLHDKNFPVNLFTDIPPVTSKTNTGNTIICLKNIRGISPDDVKGWQLLVQTYGL